MTTADDSWLEKDAAWFAGVPSEPGLDIDVYRMPAGFGRAPGPRNMPRDKAAYARVTKATTTRVIALTDAKVLSTFLPPGIEIDGDPELDIRLTTYHDCYWLAGHSYNVLILRIPNVVSTRDGDPERGVYATAMWHDSPENVITNREELGYGALWADLTPAIPRGPSACEVKGTWKGFEFFEMTIEDMDEGRQIDLTQLAPEDEWLADHLRATVFVYKYIPVGYSTPGSEVSRLIVNRMTDYWKVSEVVEDGSPTTDRSRFQGRPGFLRTGTGSFQFRKARWEDMPTQYNVVNRLASLPLVEFRSATQLFD